MTIRLYESDMQAAECEATVVVVTDDNRVILDQTVFYAQGGGQPGDIGTLAWQDGQAEVTNTTKGEEGVILHHLAEGAIKPIVGARIRASLDWDRRHRLMRMHTGLHLLCTVVGAPVTGGSIGADKGRLDFDLADSPDREAIQAGLDAAIAADYPVILGQISDADLDANPGLVRTMSVQPPRNGGVIRMVRIGHEDKDAFDYQPCGGTHVRSTGEVGSLMLGKIEKKGKQNRRISVLWSQ